MSVNMLQRHKCGGQISVTSFDGAGFTGLTS